MRYTGVIEIYEEGSGIRAERTELFGTRDEIIADLAEIAEGAQDGSIDFLIEDDEDDEDES